MQAMPATTKWWPPGTMPDRGFFDIETGPRGPYQITVTPDDVVRWNRIHGDTDPIYGSGSPWGYPVAPAGILYYPSQMFLGRYLIGKTPEAKRMGGFARYALEALSPIPVGKPLIVTGEIFDRFARRGRGYIQYRLQAECEGVVVQRHWKSWAFGLTDEEADALPQRGSDPHDADEGQVLETLPSLPFEVTIERMAELEGPGEVNGHTDVELAKRSGRPGPLTQGEISFGLLSRMLTERYGKGYLEGGTLDVRFLSPVYAGSTEVAGGEVVSRQDGVEKLRVWVEVDGTRVTAGTASARIL